LSDSYELDGTNGTHAQPPDPAAHHAGGEPLAPDTTDDAEPEGAVPPGYDWPTHGGYLGCLLGLIGACIVGGFIGSSLQKALTYYRWVPDLVAALIAVAVYAVAITALCWLGWTLGKRFYRAYPQARGRTWGEHDDFTAPAAEPEGARAGPADDAADEPASGVSETPAAGQVQAQEPAPDEPAERPSGV
jgi:hypothetical protein